MSEDTCFIAWLENRFLKKQRGSPAFLLPAGAEKLLLGRLSPPACPCRRPGCCGGLGRPWALPAASNPPCPRCSCARGGPGKEELTRNGAALLGGKQARCRREQRSCKGKSFPETLQTHGLGQPKTFGDQNGSQGLEVIRCFPFFLLHRNSARLLCLAGEQWCCFCVFNGY